MNSPAPLDLISKRVVIVEDEGVILLHLKHILRAQGMEVVGDAFDGESAVETVLATRPDLVLMDFSLPNVNGLEAARQILAQYPVCIVMLTAHKSEDLSAQMADIGVCDYLSKPVSKENLIPFLRTALLHYQQKLGADTPTTA